MVKIVRYNGKTISHWDGHSIQTELVVGKAYEVTSVNAHESYTEYTLKGVDGYFNSVWFDDVNMETAMIFIAFAHSIPIEGERFKCLKVKFSDGQPKLVSCNTTPIKKVSDMGNNIYRVTTRFYTYIVQVG